LDLKLFRDGLHDCFPIDFRVVENQKISRPVCLQRKQSGLRYNSRNIIRAWVKVGRLTDGAYQFATFMAMANETIVSPIFPELELTAMQVLGA
jgi:hypothetical protein